MNIVSWCAIGLLTPGAVVATIGRQRLVDIEFKQFRDQWEADGKPGGSESRRASSFWRSGQATRRASEAWLARCVAMQGSRPCGAFPVIRLVGTRFLLLRRVEQAAESRTVSSHAPYWMTGNTLHVDGGENVVG